MAVDVDQHELRPARRKQCQRVAPVLGDDDFVAVGEEGW
jgi:hypothetical protein